MPAGAVIRSIHLLFVAAALWCAAVTAVAADTLVFQATTPGKQALDRDAQGGNPFASALIDSLGQPAVGLKQVLAAVEQLTLQYSRGYQRPDVPAITAATDWAMMPVPPGERRVALVLVVSDYARSELQSLPGARFDAERIAVALTRAGFETETVLDLDRAAIERKLAQFADQSRMYDVAAIYSTGHGVEVDGTVHLLPGDYPVQQRNAALAARAVALPRMAVAAQGRKLNLVFWGGCRDNPLAE